jgi:formyltetrahydrofolate hydrolase
MNIYSVIVNKDYLRDHRDTLHMCLLVMKILKKLQPDKNHRLEKIINRLNEYEVIIDKKYSGVLQKKYYNKYFAIRFEEPFN